jgi:hypothetical protein
MRHAGSNDASGGTPVGRIAGPVVARRAVATAPPGASTETDGGDATAATIAATAPIAANAAVNQSIDLTRATCICLQLPSPTEQTYRGIPAAVRYRQIIPIPLAGRADNPK